MTVTTDNPPAQDRPVHELETDHPAGTPEGGIPWHRIGLVAGPVSFALTLLLPAPTGLSADGKLVLACALLMAIWWMTEAIPLVATALMPIVLFPALGIMSAGQTTAAFGDDIIFLFLGGFCIALSMQRWGLHRRIALAIVDRIGAGPRSMVLGFMVATAFISAWMSNTATTVMMLPIALALLAVVEEDPQGSLGKAMTLGIAYAASIGGVATLIGTPPNAVFAAAAEELTGRTVGFVEWMYVGGPLSIAMLFITWFLLVRVVWPQPKQSQAGTAADELIREERRRLGPMSRGEKATSVIFVLTACAWILREPKDLGAFTIPGIASAFPMVRDSSVAIAGALALFLIPVSLRRREFVLNWEWAVKLPWDVLLLIGGGLALAAGFAQSGLSQWVGSQVTAFGALPPILLIALTAAIFCGLTELTSNTATSTIAMPIMAGVAVGTGMDPLVLMATAALASSMAFMLPVSTPPNAIVFASGRVTIGEMIRAGFRMEILSVLLVTLTVYFVLAAVFGIVL